MVSKATIKLIKSLQQKKYRNQTKLFVVEGIKSVKEFLLGKFSLEYLYCEESLLSEFPKAEIATPQQILQMSGLKNPQRVIGVFKQIKSDILKSNLDLKQGLLLGLDNLQDPGNLGTIIRLADWFGIKNIICNTDTVDSYNPKVIQACMGSLNRVNLYYTDLPLFLETYPSPIYGTFMDGENIYSSTKSSNGIIIMGNEGNGISNDIAKLCSRKISIPQNTVENSTESLNVAMATAIILSEFNREILKKL